MAMPELACQALALAIRYLKDFGLERIICLGASFRPFSSKAEMTLSANTLRQLEVMLKVFFVRHRFETLFTCDFMKFYLIN